jgi:hypothetical protein
MASSSAWMKDMQDRVKKATVEVNTVLQPRVVRLSRTLEEQMQSIGLRHGKELYDEDDALLQALTSLDELRALLRSLSDVVDTHRRNLLAVASSERALGELLSAPSSSLTAVLGQHVSERQVETHVALGTAQVSTAVRSLVSLAPSGVHRGANISNPCPICSLCRVATARTVVCCAETFT